MAALSRRGPGLEPLDGPALRGCSRFPSAPWSAPCARRLSRGSCASATLTWRSFVTFPLLVQMFLWFFVFPELLPKGMGDAIKQMPPPWGSYVPAVLCLGLYTSVRVAEQVAQAYSRCRAARVWQRRH